jgi:uncharacterized repeat protein (TIGR03803 family)
MKKMIATELTGVLLALLMTAAAAHAQTFTSLASFDSTTGVAPRQLVQGLDGRFYGTTTATVYAATRTGELSVLHIFCAVSNQCLDGRAPSGSLVLGGSNLYGTTIFGGANNQGTVFRITLNGQLTTLYNFCAQAKCRDGAQPNAQLTWTASGDLFGTTSAAGPTGFGGEVFRLSGPEPSLVAVGLCKDYPWCTDGEFPLASLTQGSDGNFFSTAADGGAFGGGTVFKITPNGIVTDLHDFCQQTNCVDGESPTTLIQGSDGNFFGLAVNGGAGLECSQGLCGTAFKLAANGTFTTLYNFCSQPNCADGAVPKSLIQATDGNFYGTTYEGGINNSGTIFQLTPTGVLTTLYEFCATGTCTDGQGGSSIFQSTDGNLYGTTFYGGLHDDGTVFRLNNGLTPFVQPVSQAGRAGTTIEILGQGLTGTTAVAFNGTSATFTVVSDAYLSATVPAGATTGFVTVTTPSGTLTSDVVFHVAP